MAPFKSNELKSDWRSDFLTEETDCDCEGCGQDPCIKCGESHHNINEEVQGGVSVETYTKDTKFTEIETVDIIKAKPLVSEGNRTKKTLGSGNRKDMSKGPNESTPVDYRFLVNKGKKTVDPKKNEVIAASNELEGEQSLVEEVLVEDFMTNLYNEGYSVDEINEYLLEEYEIDEEYLEEVWGILAKGALKGAKLLSKGAGYAAKRAVKDSGKVAKFAKNSKNWARANKDTQKVIDTVAKGAKDTKELAARTYAAGQKTRQIVDAGSKNLLGPAKSFKKLTSDFKKSQQAATRAINIEKIRATKPVVTTVKAPTNVGKVELPKINWKATAPKGGTATATQKATTSVKQVTSSQPNKGLNAKFSKAKIRHRGTQELAKMQGKTPKQVKAKEVSARIEKGYNRNLEKTGDKIIKDIKATPIPKNKAIVKSPSGSLAKSTDKGSALTKTAPDKGSALTKTAPDKGSTLTKVSDKGSTLTKTQSTALSKTDDKGSALAKRKDNVKRAVAAVSFATGSAGGVEVSKKLGLINKKEKNESFSDWRSEINL